MKKSITIDFDYGDPLDGMYRSSQQQCREGSPNLIRESHISRLSSLPIHLLPLTLKESRATIFYGMISILLLYVAIDKEKISIPMSQRNRLLLDPCYRE